MKIKVYLNIIYISDYMYFETKQEFTNTIEYFLRIICSHKTNSIGDDILDVLYKDKLKDEWYCKGSIDFEKKRVIISQGYYLKQDLEFILSFHQKMIDINTSIPNVKEYLSSNQCFCYPNVDDKRISVKIQLW